MYLISFAFFAHFAVKKSEVSRLESVRQDFKKGVGNFDSRSNFHSFL